MIDEKAEQTNGAVDEWRRGDFVISTDPARIDLDVVHRFLSEMSYWAPNVPKETVARGIENSLTFGIYQAENGVQVGIARVITDKATFAYLSDVFVDPKHRGQGLSKWMMEVILAHPDLQGLRRWLLMTRDAHGLYASHGFTAVPNPEWIMQIHNPDVYKPKRGE